MSDAQSVGHEWSRRKRFAVKLSLVCASVLFALLVAEVALRVVGYTFPTFYTPDAQRGYVLKPGMQGWYRKEGESYVRINSEGLRDREHAKQKPANTFRVAILGDSYAEALQVPSEAAFWHVLEGRLRACPALGGRDVEVINFGVSGYGTAQELITLRQKVWDYSPDLVLLAVTTNNDITDNLRALKKTDEVPYFVLRDNRLVPDDSFRTSRAFRLRSSVIARLGAWIEDSSRVIQAVHQTQYALKNYLARRRARNAPPPPQNTTTATAPAQNNSPAATDAARTDELGADNLIYGEPRDATWQDAWRVTEALITAMRDEVSAHGARFAVVTLSNGIQVHPEPAAREAFMRRVGASDLFYPDKRIASIGARDGFPVFMLAPELQAHAERTRVFLHGFGADIGNGHWNAEGHRVAGELLTQKLCKWLAE
ncbi:MAG: SGNH/GDSL hydrolase family protein [Pyrinomonadaceae bacterium]